MKIIFWQNIPSFHQSAAIRALAGIPGHDITLAYQEELPQTYAADGWFQPDFGSTQLIHLQNAETISAVLATMGSEAVHIFSGFRFPMIRKAFLAAISANLRVGIIAESADWRGLKGLLRLLLYRFEFMRFGARISFLLAMGELGVRWFVRCGFPIEKIYSYAYAVEKVPIEPLPLTSPAAIKLIYIGRLVPLKGVDLLISALQAHQGLKWHLDIVGDGPKHLELQRSVEVAGLGDQITFHGALPNHLARRMLMSADFLILPSHKDGWGAVINEALMLGVPVICSDACGAAELLENSDRGEVFSAGSLPALESALLCALRRRNNMFATKEQIMSWSQVIEGETLARYLLDVVAASAGRKERPKVPWRNGGKSCE